MTEEMIIDGRLQLIDRIKCGDRASEGQTLASQFSYDALRAVGCDRKNYPGRKLPPHLVARERDLLLGGALTYDPETKRTYFAFPDGSEFDLPSKASLSTAQKNSVSVSSWK
jgi:hypothetical protein